MALTDRQVAQVKPGIWLSDSLGKGSGTLLARRTGDGVQFYYRYTLPDGKRDTLRIGAYDKEGRDGRLTLKRARAESLRLSGLYSQHPRLREWLEEQEHLAAEAIRRERLERDHATFAALLNGYVDMLEQQGKPSAPKVRGSVKLHVLETWPELAAAKASSITRRELTKIISRLVESGKGREAAKLRSYIRAAFAAALRAEGDPTIPPALHGFNLDSNPAADLAALSQFNRPRHTHLTLPEFQALWRRLQDQPGATGAALRLCLLLGGQRPAQLLRLKSSDVDCHAGTVTLYDAKGNRSQPRPHVIPLTDVAKRELEPWLDQHAGGYVLSSTNGKVPIWPETLSNAFAAIAKEMLAAGEVSEEIRLADVRRTVETLLAAAGVSMEVRAQLQSHGLGGVQNRHYDKHRYMVEKLHALQLLQGMLTTSDESNVLKFQRAG